MTIAQLRVRDLIKLLQQFSDPDALVESDGCDCTGSAVGIEMDEDRVLIARHAFNNTKTVKDIK